MRLKIERSFGLQLYQGPAPNTFITSSIIIKVAISRWTLDQGGMGSQGFHLTKLWRDLRDRLRNEGMFLRGSLSLGDLGHVKSVWMLPT